MLGPVFSWELVRAGRRRWHWWARALYICLLLVFLYASFGDAAHFTGARISHHILSEIGGRFYRGLSFFQFLAVLLLAPIYAATSVSEEKTRQTLPYLLTSRLRDGEIAFGKIALAVLRVWEVLLCGLPLCSICLLLGGVTPQFMLLDFLVAMAAAWASCALAVLVAILSRRLTEALLLVLLIQMIWYMLPVFDDMARASGSGLYVASELLDRNAFVAIYRGQVAGIASPWDSYVACLVATSVFAATSSLAAWRLLRPAWRREQDRSSPRSLIARLRRPRKAQCVWSQPFLWRELRSRRATTIDRVVGALYGFIIVAAVLSITSNWEASVQALKGQFRGPPVPLQMALASLVLYLGLLALPYLAITGATAFAEERDGNHFDLLCITLMDQCDLVHAKAVRLARVGLTIALLPTMILALTVAMGWSTWWAMGLIVLHCLAVAAFWLSLGMALSLRMAKTSHAIITTLAMAIVSIVGGPVIDGLFSNDITPIGLSSVPVHCIFLLQFDSLHPMGGIGRLSVEGLRVISAFYTVCYGAGAMVTYRWALMPAPPWRLEHEMWSSYANTAARLAWSAQSLAAGSPFSAHDSAEHASPLPPSLELGSCALAKLNPCPSPHLDD